MACRVGALDKAHPDASYALPAATHSGMRAIEMNAALGTPVVAQVVPVSPDVRYTVSAWIRRLTDGPVAIQAVFRSLDEALNATVDMLHAAPQGTYVYRDATVTAPGWAATLEIRLGHALTGTVLFDDVRVLDRNLLTNPGFETPAPGGREDTAPGWRFERGGAVVYDPAHVRGQSRALAITGMAQY